jgi:hypothetical protein
MDDDDQLIDALLEQLRRGGRDRSLGANFADVGLNDPRPQAQHSTPIESFARNVIRRRISMIRAGLPVQYTKDVADCLDRALKLGDPPGPPFADVVPVLTKEEAAVIKAIRDRLRNLLTLPQRLPQPKKTDPVATVCANEMAFLMDMFSHKPPTGTRDEPFLNGAGLLWRAAHKLKFDEEKGKAHARNACLELVRWRKFVKEQPEVFARRKRRSQ